MGDKREKKKIKRGFTRDDETPTESIIRMTISIRGDVTQGGVSGYSKESVAYEGH